MAKKVKEKEKETKKITKVEKTEKNVKNSKTKTVKKTKKDKTVKEPFFSGLSKELKLVKWPSAKEIVKYTLATLVLCIILVAFFEVLNLIMAYVKGLFN